MYKEAAIPRALHSGIRHIICQTSCYLSGFPFCSASCSSARYISNIVIIVCMVHSAQRGSRRVFSGYTFHHKSWGLCQSISACFALCYHSRQCRHVQCIIFQMICSHSFRCHNVQGEVIVFLKLYFFTITHYYMYIIFMYFIGSGY